ncbi:MAG TPA: hypothetical protein VGQ99_05380 [Tepidisphaeraceae bacterium]|jgi:hypothetical protein|nr:hypothetical protein [Tepidisphaeraceae bacterium]HEV8604774.1 hypothetical protein [Tepidisphaeraceae bacterium]
MGRAQGIICQACGIEAPVKYVEFRQNIGALVVRFSKEVKGNLCKPCVHANFWKMTLVNLTIGWLGTISIVLAPIFTIINIVQYLAALGLERVPAGASVPMLTGEAIARLDPFAQELINRLENKEELSDVARDIAPRANVSPGQVVLYVIELGKHLRNQGAVAHDQPTGGFPVVMPPNQLGMPPSDEPSPGFIVDVPDPQPQQQRSGNRI